MTLNYTTYVECQDYDLNINDKDNWNIYDFMKYNGYHLIKFKLNIIIKFTEVVDIQYMVLF